MKLYLDDGVNVNPSWVNHIAVSKDGVNWDTINKFEISVKSRWNNLPTNELNPKGSRGLITLGEEMGDILLTFDPDDVVNQPTWQGNTPANLQKAVDDITGWLV